MSLRRAWTTPTWRSDLALGAALAAAYVAAAKLGINVEAAQGVITPVWAPTGIALAALVLYGRRLWPAVTLGALLANATSGATVVESAFISAGNTLEALVGATLLLRVGFRPALDRERDVLALIGLGALLAPTVAATNGVTTLAVSGSIDAAGYGSAWLLWWIGDAMGALVVAPLLFVLAQRPWRQLTRRQLGEAAALLALLVAVGAVVFLGGLWRYPHLLFPLLVWATLRFHQLGATTGSFVVAALGVAGAVHGSVPLGEWTTREVVQIVEALTAVTAVSLLLLGAVLAQRRIVVGGLTGAHASLAEAQELAHIGSWEWEIPSNEVRWSDELYRLWGVEPGSAEMSYEWYLASIYPDDRELVRRMVDRAFTTGTPFEFDHRVSMPGGGVRWIHSRGRVVRDARGDPVRMVGTAQDITERKRLDELRDTILAAVSHELRTPLTAIRGFALTLKERGDRLPPETHREIVGHLEEQAGKLEQLLSDLLDIDRLRRGSVRPSFRETDVGRLVEEVASQHTEDSHRIRLDASSALAEVDRPKVERIVDNLVTNALTHTPAGTDIEVRVEPDGDGVQIAVDDNGPGIPAADRESIFEVFTRGDGAGARPGTGVGLALVAQFASLHGGRAWVEDRPGGGASFRVFLPRRQSA